MHRSCAALLYTVATSAAEASQRYGSPRIAPSHGAGCLSVASVGIHLTLLPHRLVRMGEHARLLLEAAIALYEQDVDARGLGGQILGL